MAVFEGDSIQIPVPFALPFLGITDSSTFTINKAYFQLFVRIVVTVCAVLLFWPKIKGAFGFTNTADTEAQRKDIQERIAKIEHERDEKKGQKSYGVVTGPKANDATASRSVPAQETATKRRKA